MKVNTKQSHKGPVQIYHKNNHSVTSALAVKARKNYVGPNYSFTDLSLSLSCILSYPKVFRGDYQRYLVLALTLLGEPSKPKKITKSGKSPKGGGRSQRRKTKSPQFSRSAPLVLCLSEDILKIIFKLGSCLVCKGSESKSTAFYLKNCSHEIF